MLNNIYNSSFYSMVLLLLCISCNSMSSTNYYESKLRQGCELRGPACWLNSGSGSGRSRRGGDLEEYYEYYEYYVSQVKTFIVTATSTHSGQWGLIHHLDEKFHLH